MRAINIFAMITIAFFFVLALFLKPVVMDTGEILSEPVERRCTEDEVVKMNESKLTNGVFKSVETDSSWVGKPELEGHDPEDHKN